MPSPPPDERLKLPWKGIVDGVFPVGTWFRTDLEREWLENVIGHNRRSPLDLAFFLRSNGVYLWEAYYFLPMQIGLRLCQAGQYEAGLDWFRRVYDYTLPVDQRKIFPRLQWEEQYQKVSGAASGWERRALNPHVVAAGRKNAYIQFTLFVIIRCLLNYADEEFAQDTGESVQRARTLYETALDLLQTEELKQLRNSCEELTVEIKEKIYEQVGGEHDEDGAGRLFGEEIDEVNQPEKLRKLKRALAELDLRGESRRERIKQVRDTVQAIKAEAAARQTIRGALENDAAASKAVSSRLLAQKSVAGTASRAATQALSLTGAASESTHDLRELAWQTVSLSFCIPPNPVLLALRRRAELNLEKIRSCRNIAGMERELAPYAAPIGLERTASSGDEGAVRQTNLRPTDYRYDTLVGRAKELVNLAQRIESSFLSALVRRDDEAYKLLQARQDLALAQTGVRLQTLRVRESEQRVVKAKLQRERAHFLADIYEQRQRMGMNAYEKRMIKAYREAAEKSQAAADWGVASAATQGAATGAGLAAAGATAAATGGLALGGAFVVGGIALVQSRHRRAAVEARSRAQVASVRASHARRIERWSLQEHVAEQNRRIAAQQISIAQAHVGVVEQQREISELELEYNEQTLEFLQDEQFTTAELFDWMADVLEDVYRYFLQQATSMAKLAEQQLAFERQELSQQFIQSGYWRVSREGQTEVSREGEAPDRRGLTGSARLLRDIYQLDQYAFRTDERKLQVSKTISLAQMAPFELQQFRESGVLTFETPEEMFDRDYPGQYFRLIKNVSVSVIALVPPTEGIKAILTNNGISRVVTAGPPFRTEVIRRDPESIALSSPQNATGVFQLQPEGEMLMPFETFGVDTSWELQMSKAANPFDYDTIADVLVTINYTALHSYSYRQQVIKQLDPKESGERAFSFRDEFVDQWYDLHNPEQSDQPMTVRFDIGRADFPPNLEDVEIENVLLYYVTEDGVDTKDLDTTLQLTPQTGQGTVGGTAKPVEQRISTRRTNGNSWVPIIGKPPVGEWELSLPDRANVHRLFEEEKIDDILLVITYAGTTSAWPS